MGVQYFCIKGVGKMIDQEEKISCVVEYGTVFAKRDMVRILRDLDKVRYVDLIDNIVVSKGDGYVIEVYANSFDSTLIFNSKLHINVNGFDFLKLKTTPKREIDLISGHRVVRLIPLTNPLNTNQSQIEEEIDEQRIAITAQLACDDEINYY